MSLTLSTVTMSFSTSGYEIDDLLKFLEDAIKGSRQLRIGQPVLLDVDWEGLSYYGVGHATHDLDVRGKRNAYYHAVLHDLIMHLETQSEACSFTVSQSVSSLQE